MQGLHWKRALAEILEELLKRGVVFWINYYLKDRKKGKESSSEVLNKLVGKRPDSKMTKSADDTELLMIIKLKRSIKDF